MKKKKKDVFGSIMRLISLHNWTWTVNEKPMRQVYKVGEVKAKIILC